MKKIYTLACGILVSGFAFAQQSVPATPGNGRPVNFTRNVPPTAQTSQSIYVDYDFMDEAWQTANTGSYTRYIWDMNMNYDYAAGDTSLKYAIVDFSALYDSYNDPGNPNFTAIPFSTYNSITIDSVFVAGGHENNSGQNDTILCKIIGLNSAGYPQTSTVLNTTSLVGNTSLGDPANDWFTTSVFGFAPAYTINNNTQKFGVMIEYHGATQDTFGIMPVQETALLFLLYQTLQLSLILRQTATVMICVSHFLRTTFRLCLQALVLIPTTIATEADHTQAEQTARTSCRTGQSG
jgi:hypothetical protein